MIERVKKAYPNASTFARRFASRRYEPPSVGRDHGGGDGWHIVEPRDITVLDRIGGGAGLSAACSIPVRKAERSRSAASLPALRCKSTATTIVLILRTEEHAADKPVAAPMRSRTVMSRGSTMSSRRPPP